MTHLVILLIIKEHDLFLKKREKPLFNGCFPLHIYTIIILKLSQDDPIITAILIYLKSILSFVSTFSLC